MLSTNKKRLFASLLSGLLFVIGFPEIGNLSVLSFFAFIPLLWVEHSVFESKDKSRKVFIYAYLAFIVFNIGTTWWIWNASVGGAIMAFTMNSCWWCNYGIYNELFGNDSLLSTFPHYQKDYR